MSGGVALGAVRALRAAVMFLTRVPVGASTYRAADWVWAPAFFPIVGAAIGAAIGSAYRALFPLGGFAAAFLALAASLLVTGAFHEDGLADTSDALGGAYDREKLLVILKDSRVGTFGAAAVVVSLVGRAALLAPLGARAIAAMALVGGVARVGPVWLMATMPYATGTADTAKSGDVRHAGVRQAIVATVWLVVVAAGAWACALPLARIGGVVVACAAVTVITGARYAKRLGGITGDFLGATEQLGELAALAVLAWPAPAG